VQGGSRETYISSWGVGHDGGGSQGVRHRAVAERLILAVGESDATAVVVGESGVAERLILSHCDGSGGRGVVHDGGGSRRESDMTAVVAVEESDMMVVWW
jgi:hypothetical protein